jgi:hypothetical protein
MASGSYARKPSQQVSLEERATKQIPARATRQLQASIQEEYNDVHNAPETLSVAAPSRSLQIAKQTTTRQKKQLSPQLQEAAPWQSAMPAHHWDKLRDDGKPSNYWLKPWIICVVSAICFLGVLISAGMFQRTTSSFIATNGQAYDIQVGGDQANTWQKNQPAPQPKILPQPGPYGVLGKPSITVEFINQVLKTYHSPAAGKGQALYDLGIQFGIDPAFALAFFMHESSFGTQGEATKSLSLGNLRCIPNFRCEDNFAQFNTWEDGFKAWYELIRNLYIAQWGLTTVDQIIPRYAPQADHNDEASYIASLKHELDTWHAGQVVVS